MSLAVKLALSPLLVAQMLLTRSRMPRLPEATGVRQGIVGRGPALRLLITGDSSAAGVGVVLQRDALAGQMVPLLARQCAARVHWQLLARSGVNTGETLQLLQQAPAPLHFDVALVVTGVNDVVDQIPTHRAVAARDALANWLRNAAGVHHVVFAPLPPVHHFHGLPQPLRWVAGADARRHNRAIERWVQTRRDVSRVDIDLQLNRAVMATDGFHPGEPAYRQCAWAIARHISTQVWPTFGPAPHQETPA